MQVTELLPFSPRKSRQYSRSVVRRPLSTCSTLLFIVTVYLYSEHLTAESRLGLGYPRRSLPRTVLRLQWMYIMSRHSLSVSPSPLRSSFYLEALWILEYLSLWKVIDIWYLSICPVVAPTALVMPASARIPPIVEPFVSERAKKTLDLVL